MPLGICALRHSPPSDRSFFGRWKSLGTRRIRSAHGHNGADCRCADILSDVALSDCGRAILSFAALVSAHMRERTFLIVGIGIGFILPLIAGLIILSSIVR